MTFKNAYRDADDDGSRAGILYSLHRAWVEIRRVAASNAVPATVELDVVAMAAKSFAVSWLGHASLLARVGDRWTLIDPVFDTTAGPVAGLGPRRLTALAIALERLPRIDTVLISHDHFDHLQVEDMRVLARQSGGPPRFFVGRGLAEWFADNVGVVAEEFAWWESIESDGIEWSFVPAQHSSGRSLRGKSRTLWGGWAIRYGGSCFYFAGDTARADGLFEEIRLRLGKIDVAAIPIGAYLPRDLMRHEHMNPREAVDAHTRLNAQQSFGVHWGTFQLGDERPMEAATDLLAAVRDARVHNFGLAAIGAVIDVTEAASFGPGSLKPPLDSMVRSVPAR